MSSGGSKGFLYLAVCIGNLLGLGAGIALGWTSPVNPQLKEKENPLNRIVDDDELTWITAFLALGAVVGPLLAGYCADRIGRKKTLLLCCGVPLTISYLILAFAQHVVLYYVARFVAGFCLGGTFTVLPNFNSEIAEAQNRGMISSSMNVFVVSGPLFAYIIGPNLSIMLFSLVCAAVPALFVVLFSLIVPESPHYLILANNHKGAIEALKKYRSTNDEGVREELEEIKRTVAEAMDNKGSFMDIFKSKPLRKAFIISLTLVTFQQFSGITIVLSYTQNIFKATGSSISPTLSSIIIGAVQLAASFVTPVAVDRLGRKKLFLFSGVMMAISEMPLGLYFHLQKQGTDLDSVFWLPVLCLIIYSVVYNLGFGPLPWTVMGEIFPTNFKSPASTATASFCWMIGFVVMKFFYKIEESIQFWIYSGCCVGASIFIVTYMIETKGKSFSEIQATLAK